MESLHGVCLLLRRLIYALSGRLIVGMAISGVETLYEFSAVYPARRALQFGHFETGKPGEILDFSPGKSF